ncbi:MAG TPA: hypothetical protein GXX55_08710 [Firmicutes bacterium]|nr:hypothetical protein [Bacillota bacterium]
MRQHGATKLVSGDRPAFAAWIWLFLLALSAARPAAPVPGCKAAEEVPVRSYIVADAATSTLRLFGTGGSVERGVLERWAARFHPALAAASWMGRMAQVRLGNQGEYSALGVAGVDATFWMLPAHLLVAGRTFTSEEARAGKPVGVITARSLVTLGIGSVQEAVGKAVKLKWSPAYPAAGPERPARPPRPGGEDTAGPAAGIREIRIVGVVLDPVDPAVAVAGRIAGVNPAAGEVLVAGGPDLYVPLGLVPKWEDSALSYWLFVPPAEFDRARRELQALLAAPVVELAVGAGGSTPAAGAAAPRAAIDHPLAQRDELPPGPAPEGDGAQDSPPPAGWLSQTGGPLPPGLAWLKALPPGGALLLFLTLLFGIPYLAGWGLVELAHRWQQRRGHRADLTSVWKWILVVYGLLAFSGLVVLVVLPTFGVNLWEPANPSDMTGATYLINVLAERLESRLPYRTWTLVTLSLVTVAGLGLAAWYWWHVPQRPYPAAAGHAGALTPAAWVLAGLRAQAFYSSLIGLSTLFAFAGIYTVLAQANVERRALLGLDGAELATRSIHLESGWSPAGGGGGVEVQLASGTIRPLLAADLPRLLHIDGASAVFAADAPVAGYIFAPEPRTGEPDSREVDSQASPVAVTVIRTTAGLWDAGWRWLAGAPWDPEELNGIPSLLPAVRWESTVQKWLPVGGEGVARDSAARLGLLSAGEPATGVIGKRFLLVADLGAGSDTLSVQQVQALDPDLASRLPISPRTPGKVALGWYKVVGVTEPLPGVHPGWFLAGSAGTARGNAYGYGPGPSGDPARPLLFLPIYPWETVRAATIVAAPGRNVDLVAAAVRSYLDEGWGSGRFFVASRVSMARAGREVQREIARRNIAASVFTLLVGAFSLFSLFLLLGERRRRRTLLQRALGAPALSVYAQLLLEALGLGAAGTVAGLLGLGFMAETFPAGAADLNWWPLEARVVITAALISLLLVLVAAAYPAWLSVRTPPANLSARE